jgi:hypothetical protein
LTLKNRFTGALIGLGIALLAIPIAFIITILLVPFWSWVEAASGFEAIGHSGPAEWCYLVVYMFVVSISGWLWSLKSNKKHTGQ